MRDLTNHPTIVGAPLLVSGRADTATSVTYRYFLKDSNNANTIGLFAAGQVTVTFDGEWASVATSTLAVGQRSERNLTSTFTIDPAAPGARTGSGATSLGPLTLQGPSLGLADFGFADGMVVLTIAIGLDRASLAFGGTPAAPGAGATQQTSSGVTVDLIGILGTFDLAVDVFGLLSGNVRVAPTGKWGLRVASLEAHVPDVVDITAAGVQIGYDPAGGASQELVRINNATITFPRFGITGTIRPYTPTGGSQTVADDAALTPGTTPGLVIRNNGFTLGTATLTYRPTAAAGANTVTPTGTAGRPISFGGILELDDITVGISGLDYTIGSNPFADFTGNVFFATSGAKLFPGKAFGATLTDRKTADDRFADGTEDTYALLVALTFTEGHVDAFQMVVDTLEARLGSFVTLNARDFRLDTGAIGTTNDLVSFQSVGATVSIGGLALTGEGRNFAFRGDGTFRAKTGFGVFLSIGSASGDSFKWPSFLPVRIDAVGITWADIENNPGDFILTLSASVTGIKGTSGLEFSGSIQGIKISPTLLAQGKFPIIGIDSLGVTIKGTMFGGTITAGLIGGILKLDRSYNIIGVFDTTTPVFQRVFYLGLQGQFSMAGLAGFGIRLGLSELGPLGVFLNVALPTGIPIFPPIGLTLNDFTAGVEFFKSLPSIADPLALRGPDFGLPQNLTADQWLAGLQQQVALQAKRTAGLSPGEAFLAAFTSPMTITGSGRIYSSFLSQQTFNGQITIKLSTDGKFLIVGKLNFAADNISLSARLYADLSKVSSGQVVILFLADIPDQVRLLTIYGKLTMGFRDSSGSTLTVNASNAPTATGTRTAPTATVIGPAYDGGLVDLGAANRGTGRFVDVEYLPATGASLDVAALLARTTAPFTLTSAGTSRPVGGTATPIVTILTDGNVVYARLRVDSTGAYYTYKEHDDPQQADCTVPPSPVANDPNPCLRVNVLARSFVPGSPTVAQVLAAAAAREGITRFRYDVTGDYLLGQALLTFSAATFKNTDLSSSAGTTLGAGNAASTAAFTVTGITGATNDPGLGGVIDVTELNDRDWIDVDIAVPTGRTLDVASVTDLAAELALSGDGLGSVTVDAARAPIQLADQSGATTGTVRFRFWVKGHYAATGSVVVSFLPGTWSFLAPTATGSGLALTATTSSLTISFPTLPTDTVPDLASLTRAVFVDSNSTLDGVQFAVAGGTGWVVTLDESRPITQVGTSTSFVIPVLVTAGTGTATVSVAVTGLSYADQTLASTPVTLATTGARTYLDVTWTPTLGHQINAGLIGSDDIIIGGFGGAGVAVNTSITPMRLPGTNTWRYFVTGTFQPGEVTLTVNPDVLGETPARAPPAPSYNLLQTLRFSVAGATADAVRTVVVGTDSQVVALAGAAIGRDLLNGRHYLEVRFRGAGGSAIDPATIDGDELQLRDTTGALVALAAPVRVGLTNVYRYGFTGSLAGGAYSLTFLAGSFRDANGTPNQAETEIFYVDSPTAALADPNAGAVLDAGDLNGRGYVDVFLTDFDGSAIKLDTVLDSGAEITVTEGGTALTVDGTPDLIDAATGQFRYYFTGHKGGLLTVAFTDGGWQNTGGATFSNASNATSVHTETLTAATQVAVAARTWLDVTYTPVRGTTVDIGSVTDAGAEFTLSGAGAESLTTNAVSLRTGSTYRYAMSGNVGAGTVTVAFLAGSWTDSDGNGVAASSSTFQTIVRGTSFYIELSGGITLSAFGLLDEPLLDLAGTITLEIDPARKLFILTFNAQLKIIKLGTVGATAGRFVLDMGTSSGLSVVPSFWGVATLETNFSGLEPYGLFLYGKGTLQVNTTDQTKVERITLKGIGPGGTDVVREFTLGPRSFSIELVGQARIRPPGTTTDLVRLNGGFYLSIDASSTPKFQLFATAELSFGVGDAQLTYGRATGLILIGTDGLAGYLSVSAGGGIGLPNVGTLFSVTGSVTVMFNTTLHDKVFTVPDSFLPLLQPTDPRTISIFKSAPGLSGQANPAGPPGGEIYVKAIIQAQLTIGGVLNLNGFLAITAAVDTTGTAYFKVDGAVGANVPFLGSLTGALNLAVYVGVPGVPGARTGVVGRFQLTRSSSAIPGITLNGQFLLEINTFTDVQTIETFAVKTKVVSGRTVFDGFQRDAAGNLVITTQTLDVVGGFKLILGGFLLIGDRVRIDGEVSLRLELAGANPGIELIVNGELALDPIGRIAIVDSGLRINAQGLVARLQLVLDASAAFGGGVGLGLTGNVVIGVNTTGVAQQFGSSTVAAGFFLRIDGSVNFVDFVTGSGYVEITINSTGFSLLFGVGFTIGGPDVGLTFRLDGGAVIVNEANDKGIALKLAVSVKANGKIFEVEASGQFLLNTTNATRLGITGHTFVLDVSGKASILKIITFQAGLRIAFTNGAWDFRASINADFFGLATLSGSIHLTSNGDFEISLSGRMVLGSDDFGIVGNFSISVTSVHRTDGTYVFNLSGSASVKVRAFGISLAGISIGFSFGFDTATASNDGRVKIELSVYISIDFGLFSIGGTVSITLGYLQFPKPVYLAGNAGATTQDGVRAWTPGGGAALELNAGDVRKSYRNIGTGDDSETFIVEQVGGTASLATIKVTAFGRSSTYNNVTQIIGNFGQGTDSVIIRGSVLIPVQIDGGDGADSITFAGSSSTGSTLSGGSGDDYLSSTGSAAVTMNGGDGADFLLHGSLGTATLNGGNNDDHLVGGNALDVLSGGAGNDVLEGLGASFSGGADNDLIYVTVDGPQAPVINGNGGTDGLYLTLSANPDNLTVSSPSANRLSYLLNGTARTVDNVENHVIDTRAGADTVVVEDLGTLSGVQSFTVDAGGRVTTTGTRLETVTIGGVAYSREVPDTRVDPDGAGDTVVVRGSTGVDSFTVTQEAQPTSAHRLGNDLKVARAGFYTVWVGQTVRSEGDRLVIEAGGGNDTITAAGLDADLAALTLRGGAGDDTLVGSRYDDVLDGGQAGVLTGNDGNDTVTGGLGRDAFFDAGGTDTLVETNDADMGLYNNLFVVGTLSGATDFAAGAVAEDLKGIFEKATLTGGASVNHLLIGDADGSVQLGATATSAQAWTGEANLVTLGGDDVVRVELREAAGALVHLTDSAGTADRLEVWGTALREDLLVDTVSSRGRIRLQSGSTGVGAGVLDLVTVDYGGVDRVELRTLSGGDRVAMRSVLAGVVHLVDLGGGDDELAVGSNAAATRSATSWPNTGGTVNAIAAGLTVVGGIGLDLVTVDDTADTAANAGELTSTLLSGLGLSAAGLAYSQLEDLRIALGSGDDTFTIRSTHGEVGSTVRSYRTLLTTGTGDDTVNLKTIDGPTTVDVGTGTNLVRVGSNAPAGAGVLSGIAAHLTLLAGGGTDTLTVDDTGATADRIGVVTGTRITGLGMTFNGSRSTPSGAPDLPDLVQVLRVQNAIAGRFTLTVAGVGTTAQLDFDSSALDLQRALEALPGMAGNVVVTAIGGTWVIAYRGALAGAPGWARTLTLGTVAGAPMTAPSGQSVVSGLSVMSDGWISYTGFDALTLGLGSGNDVLNLDATPGPTSVTLGGGNDVAMIETTAAATSVDGGTGNDLLVVNPIVVPGEANALGGDLSLQGGYGSDTVFVGLWGNGNRRINVLDGFSAAGNPDNDTNVLIVNGSPSSDTFLFRRTLIALLSRPGATGFLDAEKVVYGAATNGGVIVNGGAGDDRFAFDDTSTFMTVNGDGGNDKFSVGQLLTNYVADPTFGLAFGTGLPSDPQFDANFFASTRGWLTNGVSNPITINGGTGDDLFDIFHNKAVLTLNGEDGDDTFILRTFVADSELSKVSSGVGRDIIRYAINAPVAIDGGDGYDTVIVVGTEFADTFVITANGVYGAGRFVSYVNVERLVVDGQEGNDTFYVQSTNANVETRIIGGLGSDRVEVAGRAPVVQSDDLLGHSGLIAASIESATGGWKGIPIDGIAADVVDADAPAVVILPPSGGVVVREPGAQGQTANVATFGVRLSKAPSATVVLTVQAPAVNLSSASRSRGVEISIDGVHWGTTATLTFTAANFSAVQTVYVRAIEDNASEGERTVVLQTSVTGGGYDGVQVVNTVVRVLDRDAVGVVVGLPSGGLQVVEPYKVGGTIVSSTGSTATFTVGLNRAPLTNVTITLNPGSQLRVVGGNTLTFTPTDWAAKTITVEALNDGVVEGFSYAYLTSTLVSADAWSGTVTGVTGNRSEFVVATGILPVGADLHGFLVRITGGPGAGQYRPITSSYAGFGGLVLVAETPWDTQPTAGSTWVVTGYLAPPTDGLLGGRVLSVNGTTIELVHTGTPLPTLAGGLTGAILRITDGSGPGEYRRIASNTAWTITLVDAFGAGVLAAGTQVAVLGVPGVSIDRVAVLVADSDTPGVIITQTDGSTRVVEGGQTDTFTVRLTRAPGQNLRVYLDALPTPTAYYPCSTCALVPANRVQVSLGGPAVRFDATGRAYVEFTDSTWMTALTVTVTAIVDNVIDGSDLQAFPALARRVNALQGPLFVLGGLDPDPSYNTSLEGYLPLVLPGEYSAGPRPPVLPTIRVDETHQVDTLVVHNEDSPAADVGTLTGTRLTGLGMAPDLYVGGRLLQGGITYRDLEALEIYLGYGADSFDIQSTHAGTTLLSTGPGNDSVTVSTLDGHTVVLGGTGDDSVRVGTTAGRSLNAIRALLTVDGGAGSDTVYLDDSAETAANVGTVTPTSVTGLDMGTGTDAVWVLRPGTGSLITLVVTGVGYLQFTVGVPTTTQLAAGIRQLTADNLRTGLQHLIFPLGTSYIGPLNDPTHVVTEADFLHTGCGLLGTSDCAPSVSVTQVGGEYLIGFQGELRGSAAPALQAFDTGSGVAGLLRRGDGLQYYGLEVLDLAFGSGNDVLNVQGTGATSHTDIRLGAGDEHLYVSSGANVALGGPFPDYLPGTLDLIGGTLNLDAGTGRHTLMISDEASAVGKNAVITSVRSTALTRDGRAEAAGELAIDAQVYVVGLAGRGITYRTDGTFAGGITYWAGSGNDVIAIDATHRSPGVRTITSLNTGLGNDLVTATLLASEDGFFVLDTQGAFNQVVVVPSGAPFTGDDERPADLLQSVQIGTTAVPVDWSTLSSSLGALLVPSPVYVGGVLQSVTLSVLHTYVVHAVLLATDSRTVTVAGLLGGDSITVLVNGLPTSDYSRSGVTVTVASAGAVVVEVRWTRVETFTTTGTNDGAADNDTVLASTSTLPLIIFGGQGADRIDGGTGGDLVVGDRGRVLWFAPGTQGIDPNATLTAADVERLETLALNVFGHGGPGDRTDGVDGLVGLAITLDPTVGGADRITTGAGRDVVLGGLGGDIISTNRSAGTADLADIVLGDSGFVDYVGRDGQATDLDRIWSTDPTLGGDDTIVTGAGDDVVLGGLGSDVIDAGDGRNLVLGDNGKVTAAVSDAARWGNLPMSVGQVTTTSPELGGIDTITTGSGDDVVLGGLGGDTIGAGDGQNVVLGDNGYVDWSAADGGRGYVNALPGDDRDPSDLDRVVSTDTALGGDDTIRTGTGDDLVVGGYGNDSISVSDGRNVVIGDSGEVMAAVASGPQSSLPMTFGVVRTVDPGTGGIDTITTGSGDDVVLGGMAGDTVAAGTGNNVVVGDNGYVDWSAADGGRGYVNALPGDDRDPSDLDRVVSTDTALGGDDTITTGTGDDLVVGGYGKDTLRASDGRNVVIGDSGEVLAGSMVNPWSHLPLTLSVARTIAPSVGDRDVIWTGTGVDVVLGGAGNDYVDAGAGDDVVVGDNGQVIWGVRTGTTATPGALQVLTVATTSDDIGGADVLYGRAGDDVLIGGTGDDAVDGGSGTDLLLGDNASLDRTLGFGIYVSPRFRTLGTTYGSQLYSTAPTMAGTANLGALPQLDPSGGATAWADFTFTMYDALWSTPASFFGNDYLAGGAGNDTIFGQLGNDVVQGDGSIDSRLTSQTDGSSVVAITGGVGAYRDRAGLLHISPAAEAATDGDDYIEGGGGSDIVFGGLGQDDIVGGNSDLFSLLSPDVRPDAGDLLFGGAGTRTGRSCDDTATTATADCATSTDVTASAHTRDADTIVGDNGDIVRMAAPGSTGTGTLPNGVAYSGGFLRLNYDNYTEAVRLVVRAVTLLDYVPGGPDYAPAQFGGSATTPPATVPGSYNGQGAFGRSIWGADEVHGESGDDTAYLGGGNDVAFGDAGDDTLVGGWGSDWMSGGTGQDGILGDDGRIFTSRNSTAYGEPLYGIASLAPSGSGGSCSVASNRCMDAAIATPGSIQTATLYPAGQLNLTFDLTPFALNPSKTSGAIDDPLFAPTYANDVLFGGLGSDFLHGGSGDDALSGAEALPMSWAPTYLGGTVQTDWYHPFNDGRLLGYNSTRGAFGLYDEYDPRRMIVLNGDGTLAKPATACSLSSTSQLSGCLQWFLNFDQTEGSQFVDPTYGTVNNDGSDVLFGDYGNDWLVGGTGRDTLWGGWGNDLLNADDNVTTNSGLNDVPDTNASYEDRAVGGAGLDVLMANTGGDRLIDWVGEFNSFLVPFAPFGIATVSRQVPPGLFQFLYDLSRAQGADATIAQSNDASFARNGEPYGEVGVVTQKDAAWQAQTGGPRDPQPGNIPGGRRDVLRSADFSGSAMQLQGFYADSGTWTVTGGALQVTAASLGQDAAAVFYVDDYLPVYYELAAQVMALKPTAGWNANAFMIFDYFGPKDFKFAGIDVSTNKLVIGHRNGSGWIYDAQTPMNFAAGTYYSLLLAVNGTAVTLTVNGAKTLAFTFANRVLTDGSSVALNKGMVGMGSNNSRGQYDNVAVQVLPPQISYDQTADLKSGTGPLQLPGTSGTWASSTSGVSGTPATTGGSAVLPAVVVQGVSLASTSWLDVTTTVTTAGFAGVAFDVYSATDFKFAAIDVAGQRVVLGHVDPRRGLVIDASIAQVLTAGTAYALDVSLVGASANVQLNGAQMVAFGYNSGVVDGAFGLLSRAASATFASLRIRTNDLGLAPSISVTATQPNAVEYPTQTGTFTLTRTGPVTSSVAVTLGWGGTAAAGRYTLSASGGTLSSDGSTFTLNQGVTAATITLTPVRDYVVEPTQSVVLTVVAGQTYTVGSAASATVSLADDSTLPTLSVTGTSVAGKAANQLATITVTLSAASTSTVAVLFKTVDGTALAGKDYTAVSTTVSFAPGVTSMTVSVPILGRTTGTVTKSFTVQLSNSVNAAVATPSATVTITSTSALTASSAAPTGAAASPVTSAALAAAARTAEADWVRAGIDPARFARVRFVAADLPGEELGLADGLVVVIDPYAAGWGWSIGPPDPTRMDLVTALRHELGHVLGLSHEDGGLMGATLAAGVSEQVSVLRPVRRDPAHRVGLLAAVGRWLSPLGAPSGIAGMRQPGRGALNPVQLTPYTRVAASLGWRGDWPKGEPRVHRLDGGSHGGSADVLQWLLRPGRSAQGEPCRLHGVRDVAACCYPALPQRRRATRRRRQRAGKPVVPDQCGGRREGVHRCGS